METDCLSTHCGYKGRLENLENLLFRLVSVMDEIDSKTEDCTRRLYALVNQDVRQALSSSEHWRPHVKCPYCGQPRDLPVKT